MLSEVYAAQVRLLLRVLAELGEQDTLALKGGTAINLFVQNLPRLSVDIDLAYTGLEERAVALEHIHAALSELAQRLKRLGLQVFPTLLAGTSHWVKLVVSDGLVQIKVEVNPVLRGTLNPPLRLSTSPSVQEQFGYAEMSVLALPDLYAGKLVAALDRQHPRDLFDVHLFLEQQRLDRATIEAFVIYLISHARPPHEILNPSFKPLQAEFQRAFLGMTKQPITIEKLEAARKDLLRAIHLNLTPEDRAFLVSVVSGKPNWSLIAHPEAENLPAVRWKLQNVANMQIAKREKAVLALENVLKPTDK